MSDRLFLFFLFIRLPAANVAPTEMQVISGLKQHRNVLQLLAYRNEDDEQIQAYEYMHRCSLDAYTAAPWVRKY